MNSKALLGTPQAFVWDIEQILKMAESGRLQIPIFQRNFRWDRHDILNLFDSLYRGFPIGNLLVWKTESSDSTGARFGPLAFEKHESDTLIIIDGQQRLVSIIATMLRTPDHDDRRFKVYFDLEEDAFKQPSSKEHVPDTWLPMTEIADTVHYLEWLQSTRRTTSLIRKANEVVKALRDYEIPVYQVSGGIEQRPIIRQIFRRLNTTGRRLTEAEIFNAVHRTEDAPDLASIAEGLRAQRFGSLSEKWILKATATMVGLEDAKELADLLSSDPEYRTAVFDAAHHALYTTITFLRDDAHIPHWSLLPYRFPIGPLCAFFSRFPEPSNDERRLLRQWLWRGAESGKHAANNGPAIRAVLKVLNRAENAQSASQSLLESVSRTSRSFELTKHNRSHAKTRIACCVLANLGPRHLETGKPLDLETLLSEHEPFPQLFVRAGTGTELRLLHPPLVKGQVSNARALREIVLDPASPANILPSHLIEPEALECLKNGDIQKFIAVRGQGLKKEINRFLNEVCGDQP